MRKNSKNKAVLKPTVNKAIHEPGFSIFIEEELSIEPVILDDKAKAETVGQIEERVTVAQTKKELTEEERINRILRGELG